MARPQTWTVTLHEVLGSAGNVYFWTPDLTQGAVEGSTAAFSPVCCAGCALVSRCESVPERCLYAWLVCSVLARGVGKGGRGVLLSPSVDKDTINPTVFVVVQFK